MYCQCNASVLPVYSQCTASVLPVYCQYAALACCVAASFVFVCMFVLGTVNDRLYRMSWQYLFCMHRQSTGSMLAIYWRYTGGILAVYWQYIAVYWQYTALACSWGSSCRLFSPTCSQSRNPDRFQSLPDTTVVLPVYCQYAQYAQYFASDSTSELLHHLQLLISPDFHGAS